MLILTTNAKIASNGVLDELQPFAICKANGKKMQIVNQTGLGLQITPVAWMLIQATDEAFPESYGILFQQLQQAVEKGKIYSSVKDAAGAAVITNNSVYLLYPQDREEVNSLIKAVKVFPHYSGENTQIDDILSLERMF